MARKPRIEKTEFYHILNRGDASLNTDKWLVVYSVKGNVLYKTQITSGKNYAMVNGTRYEPEGLEIKDNFLYATFMSGEISKNIKSLYKILEINK